MKRAFVAALAAAVALSPVVAHAQKKDKKPGSQSGEASEDVNIPVGGNKTYPAADVKNYSEGVPGIADVKLSSDATQFVIVGQKPGSTTLLLLKKDGTQTTLVINVFARSPEVVKRELGQLLENSTGLSVRQVGSRFFIEGGVNTEGEAKRVAQIASLYQGQVESLVSVGAPSVDRKFNIRIDFFFVQYDKRYSYGVGISYPGRIGGEVIQSNLSYDLLAGQTLTAQASVVNQPLPGLDLASRKGWAKVLKQATVIMQNGTEALFESGGEQNYAVATGLTSTIFKIPFGTNVTVLPRYEASSSDLEVKVQADVSDLVPAATGTNLPGRNTSKLNTNVHMKLGQSVVLSGIRTQSKSRAITGLPLLSEIPVLGVLFGSHSGESTDVEGAIFIVPSVVEAVPRSSVDLVGFAMKQYEKFSGDIDEVSAYDKKPPAPPAAAPAAPEQ
jgi:pilus assembly protein CpaC